MIGVLKSGAAFSVIDPAYPSDRQCIYLDVAQPKGLIVIDKASREDGRITSQVRSFIDDSLSLKAEIPALELLDNGTLRGGSLGEGKDDCLFGQGSRGAEYPNVIVGPDSQPTLSFTSGSEGRPKGVQGRHYSLTYYQPWMARTFNLTEKDRFTMLSGIAHDPIQRDCFTPMFLGAQLLIPAKEDIQHERLAEWMRQYQATVTHLTPAMGQILVGGAKARFPSLHHAFFVGDVLMTRDCHSLQRLAPNCRVVNMFGTTETQRAVSYFEIPSQDEEPNFLSQMPPVIPAGRGMKDVQVLVVDRASLEKGQPKLCEIGEVGEIFIRAGGLAEGYLGSDDLNKAKFIPNFFLSDPRTWQEKEKEMLKSENAEAQPWRAFWKGPRDRLYRSGDLGRYIETGDAECTGRADNQVKIRGFRIELGEIDTHLSKHPLVRENVTLVRRDKYEEPTLVSYYVVDMAKWPAWAKERGIEGDLGDDSMLGMLLQFRALGDDARATLKKKLPSYAVPTVFIPLKAMPMTPNYKIDRRALPYPDEADLIAAAAAAKKKGRAFTQTEELVEKSWASRLRKTPGTMNLDDDFFENLGGNSLIAQGVLLDMKNQAKVRLTVTTIFGNSTLEDFAEAVENAKKSETSPSGLAEEICDYDADAEALISDALPKRFASGPIRPKIFLLTGATGFLGVSILTHLLHRIPDCKLVALVRASSPENGLDRVKTSCIAFSTWQESWTSRIECVPADLSKGRLGLSPDVYSGLENTVDVVIHNAAVVHWIRDYQNLKPTNVLSTLSLLALCSVGKPKHLTFVSTTAVLDSGAYEAATPIREFDDLSRSRTGLSNGYGQTKFVSERLIREAGKRGLRGAIVRPGYITGNPDTGIGPTDDFLLRILKGSVQLSCYPDLGHSSINLVPVAHCANVVATASLPSEQEGVTVYQVTPHPRLPFHTFLSTLERCGYDCPKASYDQWRSKLEAYVSESSDDQEPHALLPLFDWVMKDLPVESSSKELDDGNVQALLGAEKSRADATVTQDTVQAYLGYMVDIGFLVPPPMSKTETEGIAFPRTRLGQVQREALGKVGRGGA